MKVHVFALANSRQATLPNDWVRCLKSEKFRASEVNSYPALSGEGPPPFDNFDLSSGW
ncbi:hypothetical protein Fuma_06254 [Fuerstiella marisgermanici]|uniref:Uncharacterized protein n=1 Tax=Fuerstiella marisgermanici TaxID=1891926 RepID=A0A1P8WR95_9PLAN|nr:hypothetical protein Fuma_06254 [Fuerstiella marisgermanici]